MAPTSPTSEACQHRESPTASQVAYTHRRHRPDLELAIADPAEPWGNSDGLGGRGVALTVRLVIWSLQSQIQQSLGGELRWPWGGEGCLDGSPG
ncbi:hypothetical protein TIFTF001_007238 [Ficus carica]|uniref:Uncharacterized protein n=1 Tax=Ficus carica TaxID=3494 RepID=A0AA88DGC7_FICCA|nr:hypothetical protein TIFTF001_007238 [Ficus carica]